MNYYIIAKLCQNYLSDQIYLKGFLIFIKKIKIKVIKKVKNFKVFHIFDYFDQKSSFISFLIHFI